MEYVKIYLLMALISAIAAASHIKVRRDTPNTGTDHSPDTARV